MKTYAQEINEIIKKYPVCYKKLHFKNLRPKFS